MIFPGGRLRARVAAPQQALPRKRLRWETLELAVVTTLLALLVSSILTSVFFVGIRHIFLVRDPHRHFDNHKAAADALSLALH